MSSQHGDNFIRSVSKWTADHASPLEISVPNNVFFCPLIPLAVTGLLISKLRAAYGSYISRKDIALRDEGCRSISVSALFLRPKLYSLWWLNPTQKCLIIPYNCRKPSADSKVGSTIDHRSSAPRALPSLYYAEASANIERGGAEATLLLLPSSAKAGN